MIQLLVKSIPCPLLLPPSKLAPARPLNPVQEDEYAQPVAKSRRMQSDVGSFWRERRTAREMDEVYSSLLKAGSSATKRHYELTGVLAQEEARRDPEYARTRDLLQGSGGVPGTTLAVGALASSASSGEGSSGGGSGGSGGAVG